MASIHWLFFKIFSLFFQNCSFHYDFTPHIASESKRSMLVVAGESGSRESFPCLFPKTGSLWQDDPPDPLHKGGRVLRFFVANAPQNDREWRGWLQGWALGVEYVFSLSQLRWQLSLRERLFEILSLALQNDRRGSFFEILRLRSGWQARGYAPQNDRQGIQSSGWQEGGVVGCKDMKIPRTFIRSGNCGLFDFL